MNLFPANAIPTSGELMDAFLRASAQSGQSAREAWLAREVLQGLMRLARSEQLLDIRRSVDKLVPASIQTPAKRSKSRRAPRTSAAQKQFVFGREN
ncbi:MAG: hypothetical protein NBV65_07450 [Burkholderiaceae bacterium]|nr:hypothetical protein [Burkholderiaceae bacterium]